MLHSSEPGLVRSQGGSRVGLHCGLPLHSVVVSVQGSSSQPSLASLRKLPWKRLVTEQSLQCPVEEHVFLGGRLTSLSRQ